MGPRHSRPIMASESGDVVDGVIGHAFECIDKFGTLTFIPSFLFAFYFIVKPVLYFYENRVETYQFNVLRTC